MHQNRPILRVAVFCPLRRLFDYCLPADWQGEPPPIGVRVKVPFGRQQKTGVVIAVHQEAVSYTLRPVECVLDAAPLWSPVLLRLLQWASQYYACAAGEALATALPALLRQGRPAQHHRPRVWRLNSASVADAEAILARAPKQQALYRYMDRQPGPCDEAQLNEALPGWRDAMRALERRGMVSRQQASAPDVATGIRQAPAFELNDDQSRAVDQIAAAFGRYQGFLLHGVTGSGKTEVYLRVVERLLESGRQALILVPEIGLTPQLLASFRQRFEAPMAVLHSGLNDTERLQGWLAAAQGEARIVIGTRSAVFVPLKDPGLIIVDEEHDSSFKQMDGFRYSARDVAIKRAADEGIPVVLGSATPSLETLHNADSGKLARLDLPERVGAAGYPDMHLIDLRGRAGEQGMAPATLQALREEIERGGQAMVFLNRRGFAPALVCGHCGWVSQCERCDVRMTIHKAAGRLRCHVCDRETPLPQHCPECGQERLLYLGHGTERLEAYLREQFGEQAVVRIDRDTTRRKDAFADKLEQIRSGEKKVLIGTQMLAKGHHFPNVGTVVILDADAGLYGLDFRAQEHMAQLITQVAGRAGREERAGRVYIQTWHPEHPFFAPIRQHAYAAFAGELLQQRQATKMPPYSYLLLLRAAAQKRADVEDFMHSAAVQAESWQGGGLEMLGPAVAPLERKAGYFHMQLIIRAGLRQTLQQFQAHWVLQLEGLKQARRVRWSVDVDPYDLY